jgi:multicomponent Na+:H+ antiporter subunit C
MSGPLIYALAGAGLFALGFWAMAVRRHLFWKVLGFNVAGSGAFLMLLGISARSGGAADPVPQAMVLTGIVVAVSATALALALALRVTAITGRPYLPEDDRE